MPRGNPTADGSGNEPSPRHENGQCVTLLVKTNKNDAADAAAICEAVTRPTMRFVAVKGPEQQSVLMLHRTRELLVRQRTMLVTAIRAHMAEFGIVAPVGIPRVKELLAVIADAHDDRLPPVARTCLEALARQYMSLHDEITAAEKRIHAWHRSNETSRRLETIPGIGPITASALAASITDPALFKSGRELAAWIGLFSEIERDDIKSALRENTDFVIARGAFGVPTFLVGERLFFGQDRLDFIKQALSEP